MDYNPSIFKAYDIRGLVGKDFDDEFCEALGRAFVLHTGAKVIVAGRDMRGSSPGYFAALTRGMMRQGADVIDVGMVSTPMFYFSVSDYDLHDAGIMVTASHNPAEYNGFKMVHGDAMPIGKGSGMEELKALVAKGEFPDAKEGTLVQTDIVPDYLERLFALVPPDSIRKLKVVVDAGNGMGGVILPKIFEMLPGVEVHRLFWEPDGTFPNHEANPLKTETLADLQKKIKDVGADIGVALDGDSDRIGLVDEKGEIIRADQIIAMLAHVLLPGNVGDAVTYNVSCGNVAPEEIKASGGVPVMTPTGHALIKPILRANGGVFGGELSGHFYFREFFSAENTDYVMLLALQLLSRQEKPMSELVAPFRRYAHSGEINFKVSDAKAKMAAIREKYAPDAATITEIDGLRLDMGAWWCSIRASNTEPLLRLNVEAATREMMEEKKTELSSLITA
ncbi:MAG TPA: phosphomannomutase/phosphoglucomutase [Candidatus Baltobacteraceae bacterium]|nr:phosphomannomutase/phosphoglucomutase [Candidatus Baltobacteraceae bacterium]